MLRFLKYTGGVVATFLLLSNVASAAGNQFERNLYFGLRADTDVIRLQDLLRKLGYFTYPVSNGNYFGLTREAVRKFQLANNISPVSGYFGPITRFLVNHLPGTNSGQNANPSAPAIPATATSTYFGKVKISAKYKANSADDEYLTIGNTATTTEEVNITGFRLTNSHGDEFTIPKGYNLPGTSATPQDNIILKQYDTVEITTGRQEKQMNFRENLCTGYLDQNSSFRNKLYHSCPRPDLKNVLNLPSYCVAIFESASSCRTVDPTKIEVAECLAYSEAHYNYQGCVNDFKNQSNFYKNRWLVWMQKSAKFLGEIHDRITLYDREGKIVHVFTF